MTRMKRRIDTNDFVRALLFSCLVFGLVFSPCLSLTAEDEGDALAIKSELKGSQEKSGETTDEESGEEIIDRVSIVSEFDKKAKPTTLAIDEVITDKLKFEYDEKEEE